MSRYTLLYRPGPVALATALFLSAPANAQDAEPSTLDPVTIAPTTDVTTPLPDDVPADESSATVTAVATEAPSQDPDHATATRAPAKSPRPSEVTVNPVTQVEKAVARPEQSNLLTPMHATDSAKDQAPPVEATASSSFNSDAITFGGTLALLVLSAGAIGFARRRRQTESADTHEGADPSPSATLVREIDLSPPTIQAPQISRPAFHWGPSDAVVPARSRMEQARLGPTPDNPSLSLKKRIKRAHFFEQRAKEAAAGRAVSVSSFAGLPQRLVDKARREFVFSRRPALQPA